MSMFTRITTRQIVASGITITISVVGITLLVCAASNRVAPFKRGRSKIPLR